jgi:hypothetical protein
MPTSRFVENLETDIIPDALYEERTSAAATPIASRQLEWGFIMLEPDGILIVSQGGQTAG